MALSSLDLGENSDATLANRTAARPETPKMEVKAEDAIVVASEGEESSSRRQ